LSHKRDGTQFVGRNMFCSGCDPVTSGPRSMDGYDGQPAQLIATSIGAYASATVRVTTTEVQGSWNLHETIPGVGEIVVIAPTFIEVADARDHRSRLSLLGSGAATPDPKRPAVATDAYPGVHERSETEFEVDRKLVRELVASSASIKDVRMVPLVTNGEVK